MKEYNLFSFKDTYAECNATNNPLVKLAEDHKTLFSQPYSFIAPNFLNILHLNELDQFTNDANKYDNFTLFSIN